jgi:hypothetical protein
MRTELVVLRDDLTVFSNSFGENSRGILNKSPKYIICPIFFTFTVQKMALAIGQQRSILRI